MTDQNSQFFAILTAVGEAKQANANALGVPWTFSQMGVGDANGVEPVPLRTQTRLINERRRAPLNQLKVDPDNLNIIVAEQVIPPDVGGWWIREIGLYDTAGDLVAVANCAPSFKPLLSQGTGKTQVVRLNIIVTSTANVQLKIDPSVVLATREWVTEELARQDFKHSVLAATTAAITLSGVQTVDGVALTAGARVLVKNQATAKDNGLYQVVSGGTWTRCPDADTNSKVTPGMLVLVERGTINADSAWQLVTEVPITVGVTALTYEMAFGRTGVAAGSYRSVTIDTYGRVTAATNPTSVAGYGLTDVYTQTQVNNLLAAKAPLVSPTLTGTPTAPTPAAGTNTTQLANTAFVQAAITALISAAPGALDTLNELAVALGNDPNFATTITNALALKAPLDSPLFTDDPRAPTASQFDADTSIATTEFVQRALGNYGKYIALGGSVVLTAAHVGAMLIGSVGLTGGTVTLPLSSAVPAGSSITISAGAGEFTLAKNAADLDISIGLTTQPSLKVGAFESIILVSTGTSWRAFSGSVPLKYHGSQAALLTSSGYQKLPSGKIEQWGFILTPAGVATANIDVVFPMQFPNACLNAVASIGIYTADYDYVASYRSCRQELSSGVPTKTGIEMQAFMDNNLNSVRVVYWQAVGY